MAAQDEVFNTSTITESTGETDHEQLEEIEVIFGNFKYIDSGALRKCRNLQKFTIESRDSNEQQDSNAESLERWDLRPRQSSENKPGEQSYPRCG
ncbi:hypothetical protein F441_14489 [Phytophthora nicotianae CJ01A1]|uniref:Uncharacterized protein n=5 Tax=Phytophthora nicotianae TaxID=4792 RepID=V9EKW1_PHYNI|nr:hypothetical protein F443_14619 [Phytophthora nicotianae P1569]ETK79958.1 hypothetical protein L915_14251 [Phytophthora nicotianae]ETO68545.1 hypothetical protein F444_14632 [Phytophthora nicotianae P1976]ETP09699.1 hypothetical protein F441_14489 [Phytophthora nicotianae CJ01A1]ETP37870.1 hypothetical protein F442_14446 [Phytophthora nicotianae P10297]